MSVAKLRSKEEIAEERVKLEERLAALDDEEQLVTTFPPEVFLAQAMHDMQCTRDHTDGCAWDYETWPAPTGGTRYRWVNKAKRLIEVLPGKSLEEIKVIVEILRG